MDTTGDRLDPHQHLILSSLLIFLNTFSIFPPSSVLHYLQLLLFCTLITVYPNVTLGYMLDLSDYQHSSASTKWPECSPGGLIRKSHYPCMVTICIKLQNPQIAKVFFSPVELLQQNQTVRSSNKYLLLDLVLRISSLNPWLQ